MDLANVENFGGIDADADALLRDCFQDHTAYTAAREHERFLVLGRKGSGKTAIFKRLITERTPTSFSFGHTFDDYPWHYHDLQAQVGVPEELRFVNSWRYLVLMGLAKVLLNVDQSQPWHEDAMKPLETLENFVVDSYGSRDPDFTQLFLPERELRFSGSLKLALASVGVDSVRVKDLPTHVQEVNASVQDAVLTSLNPESDYYVCFDQLDRGFTLSEGHYGERLVGLLIAARDLFIAARDAGKRLSVVVFLRDDIYDTLQFEDKNKITENFASNVIWTRAEGDLTLKALMERRFGEVLRGGDEAPWDDVFDEEKEMPGRQTKYAHICDRTFLRPRDMIKFCNEILASYKVQNANGDEAERFDNESVHAARDAYSEYLLKELDDEIAKHAPDYREHLEVIRTLGGLEFSIKQWEEAWANRPSLADQDARQALRQLFEFSVVGFLKSGGRGGGSKYIWRYLDPRARFDDAADVFRVHAGFKEALDLKTGSGG